MQRLETMLKFVNSAIVEGVNRLVEYPLGDYLISSLSFYYGSIINRIRYI